MVFDWRASLNPLYEHMTIYADKHKISQVLRNLISNALKFTPAGGTIQCVVAVLKVKSAADNETQSVHAVMNSADKGDESVSYKQIDKFSMGGSANSFVENHSPNRTPSVRFSPQTSAGQLDRQSTPDGSLPATFSLVGAWNSVKSKSSKSHIYSGGVETGSYKLENISQDAVRDHVVDPAAIKNMICRIEIHDTGVGISAVSALFLTYLRCTVLYCIPRMVSYDIFVDFNYCVEKFAQALWEICSIRPSPHAARRGQWFGTMAFQKHCRAPWRCNWREE